MTDVFELRNKPELKIIMTEYEIEIIDDYQSNNCGTFSFQSIKRIQLNPKRTDWLFTIFSWILDLFIGGGFDNYKNSANLKIETVNKTLKTWLNNADFNKAERVAKFINDRKISNIS